MRIYLDTSALLKRVRNEDGSGEFRIALRSWVEAQDQLFTSSLSEIEVERSLRALAARGEITLADDAGQIADIALSGITPVRIDPPIIKLARRLGPPNLRSLDALHLASAQAALAEVVVTYDQRMATAARSIGLKVDAPGLSG